MKSYWSKLGFYTGNEEEPIVPSPINTKDIQHQDANTRKKFVKVGKARIRIKGL